MNEHFNIVLAEKEETGMKLMVPYDMCNNCKLIKEKEEKYKLALKQRYATESESDSEQDYINELENLKN